MTPNPPTEAVKPPLAVIHATHASLGGMKDSGVLGRHARTLRAYKERFDVTVFSADTVGYSDEIGVRHRPVPWMPRTAGFRHATYYARLVLNARRMQGALRVFGQHPDPAAGQGFVRGEAGRQPPVRLCGACGPDTRTWQHACVGCGGRGVGGPVRS